MLAAHILASRENAALTSDTLTPLPLSWRNGIIAVTVTGFLSLLTTVALLLFLVCKFVAWIRKNRGEAHINQHIILIFNLVLADIHQSAAFSICLKWLWTNSVEGHSAACWAQGWFLTCGDVGSSVFTFAIASHAFADIVFNFRLGRAGFLFMILALWIFNYFCSTIGIALHPKDFYMVTGPWCWVPTKYITARLWIHFVWIMFAEFASIVLYAITILVVRFRRLHGVEDHEAQRRSASAAKSMAAHPIIYCFCTFPTIVVGLYTLAGGTRITVTHISLISVFLCSSGWLDVLLFSLTRRILIFGPMPNEDVRAIDTFTIWSHRRAGNSLFGNTTTIEVTPQKAVRPSARRFPPFSQHQRQDISDANRGASIIRTETVVDIRRELCSPIEEAMIKRLASESDLTRSRSPARSDGAEWADIPNLHFLSEEGEDLGQTSEVVLKG